MVVQSITNGQSIKLPRKVNFRSGEDAPAEVQEQKENARLLYDEKKNHPVKTALKIEGEKLKNAFSIYPKKGLTGSKNANFYEFLTMGTVPYLIGSGMMMAVFNAANRFYDTPSSANAAKAGGKMALGVLFYGIFKNLSKKLTEVPLNMKYGIDVNVPYRKKIDELPEERNINNLVSYEYHKAYESVDFPYWDLFYGNKAFGDERGSYFKNAGKKMGFSDEELTQGDQKVKPEIRKKLVQVKAFTSLSSYLWAACGVGIAMQHPFEGMLINPVKRFKDWKNGIKNPPFITDFGRRFIRSCKSFIGSDRAGIKDYIVSKLSKNSIGCVNKPLPEHKAARTLLALAGGTALLGNYLALRDTRSKKPDSAAVPLIDSRKKKVVC